MELSQHGFLEELLALRRDSWNPIPLGGSDFFPNGWSFGAFDDEIETPVFGATNPNSTTPFAGLCVSTEPQTFEFDCSSFSDVYPPLTDGLATAATDMDSEFLRQNPPPAASAVKDEDFSPLGDDDLRGFEEETNNNGGKIEEHHQAAANFPVFSSTGVAGERKNRARRLEGQPSKNLMAERRRRKRLNDRLSMLRSIVPKISKMDRTSILGDTIDYMKELLERINKLQEDQTEVGTDLMNSSCLINDPKPNEALIRNSPKFDVERREVDTRIEICCATKPGLMLSTVNTLEALGLEIQQCVISCFNDFSMQASCTEEAEQRTVLNSEDIKQALFRTAGYGGRCL